MRRTDMNQEERIFAGILFFPGDPKLKAIKLRTHNLNVDYKAVMTKTNKLWTLNKILYHMEIEKKNERR